MKILYLPNQYSQQRQREKKRWIYPIHLAMEAEYYRKQGHEVFWGEPKHLGGDGFFPGKVVDALEGLPFLSLPHADRIFTNAFDPHYQCNGNFKYHPGTYIQAATGCWHGGCDFCVERGKKWEVRPVEDVIDEIGECKALGFKEVFDDSGTFPTGDWLDKFIDKMPDDIKLSCNMRMCDLDYTSLRRAGFRMLLFGLESANQKTLDRLNKGTRVADYSYIIKAARAGLEPHVAVMFGYPWESDSDALETLKLVWWLLKKGYAKTAQASLYVPPIGEGRESHHRYCKRIYEVGWSPIFWFNKIRDIHNIDDLKYLWRQIKEGVSNV